MVADEEVVDVDVGVDERVALVVPVVVCEASSAAQDG